MAGDDDLFAELADQKSRTSRVPRCRGLDLAAPARKVNKRAASRWRKYTTHDDGAQRLQDLLESWMQQQGSQMVVQHELLTQILERCSEHTDPANRQRNRQTPTPDHLVNETGQSHLVKMGGPSVESSQQPIFGEISSESWRLPDPVPKQETPDPFAKQETPEDAVPAQKRYSNSGRRAHVTQHLNALAHKRRLGVKHQAKEIVSISIKWEVLTSVLIGLNTIFLGLQVQYEATHRESNAFFLHLELCFCIVFSFDVFFRVYKMGFGFVRGIEWQWNAFDLFVVSAMVVEQAGRLSTQESSFFSRFSILRSLRLLRLVRILRMGRILSVFREFRLLIDSIQKSVRSVFWIVFLLFSMLYIVAIALTQATFNVCAGDESGEPLCEHFGTLWRSLFSLYKAIYGGILWGDLVRVLAELEVIYVITFISMISFSLIVVVNIVMGIILEIEQDVSYREREALIEDEIRERENYVSMMEEVFKEVDINMSGDISLDEFELSLQDTRMEALFSAMQMDLHDVRSLFDLLDRDRNGQVGLEEFILGCLRLKGQARSADIVKLQLEVNNIMYNVIESRRTIDDIGSLLRGGESSPKNIFRSEEEATFPEPETHANEHRKVNMQESDPNFSLVHNSFNPRNIFSPETIKRSALSVAKSWGMRSHKVPWRTIDKVEERAMSLSELLSVQSEVKSACVTEGWVDMETATSLRPEDVNLYHFNYYRICPKTVPDGISLEGLSGSIDAPLPGEVVEQADFSGRLNLPLAQGIVKSARRADGSLEVEMTRGRFERAASNTAGHVVAGGLDCGVPKEVSPGVALSYKELVSNQAARPRWYCSHFWGESIMHFVACCERHSRLRRLTSSDALYWVCAFANRQNDLGTDICGDPDDSSFRKAMRLADGVLLILDPRNTPFRRIWCDFELYKTLADPDKLLDIITMVKQGVKHVPCLLSDGALPMEGKNAKNLRELHFPISHLALGMRVRLEDGDASNVADKDKILACIHREDAGGNAVQRANLALHAYLARAAWPQAVKRGLVENFGETPNETTIRLPDVLVKDEMRTCLGMNLGRCDEVTDGEVAALARGIPPNLKRLELSFEGCRNVGNAGVEALARCLPMGLTSLSLDFLSCPKVTDNGVEALAHALPASLLELHLVFAKCGGISEHGAACLACHLPAGLHQFSVALTGTKVNRNFTSAQQFRAALLEMVPQYRSSF